jgi:hypothetical protein
MLALSSSQFDPELTFNSLLTTSGFGDDPAAETLARVRGRDRWSERD